MTAYSNNFNHNGIHRNLGVGRFACCLALGLFMLFGATAEESTAGAAKLLLAEDFSEVADNPLAEAILNHRLLDLAEGAGVAGSNAVRATYQGYDRGSERIVQQHALSEKVHEATLNYDVRFDEAFQFVRGGKLHGLGPDRQVSGGLDMRPDGWSTRVNFTGDESLRTYLYIQNKDGVYGAGRSGDGFTFERDRYYAVSIHVRMNSEPESEDGFARIYVDGALLVDHDGAQFRGTDAEEALISHLLISTFHGGSNPDWAPVNDDGSYATVYAWFDNFAVYEGEQIRQQPGPCWR